jgi:hypothetical protein
MIKTRINKRNRKEFEDYIRKHTDEIFNKLGPAITQDAKRIVPVETGALRDSLDWDIVEDELKIYATEDYAAEVELGTSRQKAQPYLRPALETKRRI